MTTLTRALCATLLTLAATAHAHAQSTVTGTLADSIAHEPIAYATIRVFAPGSQHPAAMAVTKADGSFTLTIPTPGTYAAIFSSMGKKMVQRTFALKKDATLNLGTVNTADDASALQGVEVVALKPLVTVQPDKLSYDIAADPETPARNALEMLRKVPLVAVDGQDNITVKGSSSFKIYVNGKPNPMFSSNAKEILKAMPASSIQKVEVITDPGAKYDAEGTAGIINIVTAGSEQGTKGYSATFSSRLSDRGVGGGINLLTQVGKLTMNVDYNYNHRFMPWMDITTDRTNHNSEENNRLLSTNRQKVNFSNMHFGGLNASYELTKHDLITLGAQFFGYNMHNTVLQDQSMLNSAGQKMWTMSSSSRQRNSNFNTNVHADYQHTFNDKGRMLTLSYNLSTQPGSRFYQTEYDDNTTLKTLADYEQNTHTHFTEHTAQVDMVMPVNQHHYTDAGFKFINRRNTSEAVSTFADNRQQDAANSGDYANTFNIAAAYADYRYTLGSFSVRGGLRYELSRMSIDYAHLAEKNFSKTYNNLVPSLSLNYVPSPTKQVKLAYQMRISRPSIEMLNPFEDRSDALAVSHGSPSLDTEKNHEVELSYGSFGAKLSMNLSLAFSNTDNGIAAYSTVRPDGVAVTTYGNVLRDNTTRGNIWVSYNPWKLTRLMLSANVAYMDLRSHTLGRHVSGWKYETFINAQQQLPAGFTAAVFAAATKQMLTLDQQYGNLFVYGANISAALLKDKRLNIGLSVVNPFQRFTPLNITSSAPEYNARIHVGIPIRNVNLIVSYRLGSLKASVKRVERSIENNDVKAAEAKGASGVGEK